MSKQLACIVCSAPPRIVAVTHKQQSNGVATSTTAAAAADDDAGTDDIEQGIDACTLLPEDDDDAMTPLGIPSDLFDIELKLWPSAKYK